MASTSQHETPDPFARPLDLLPVQLSDLVLDSSVASVPIECSIDRLDNLGPQMLKTTAKCNIDLPQVDVDSPKPQTMRLSLPKYLNQSLKPTHMLAVSGFDNPHLTLAQPVFGLVSTSAVHCSSGKGR